MKVWWINVAAATRRRTAMERQLDQLGLEGRRVEAVTPADLTGADKAAYCDPRRFRHLSETQLCCGLSHARALRMLAASGDNFGVVLEDDAVLSQRLPQFLAALEAAGPAADLIRVESVPDPLTVDPRPALVLGDVALRRVLSRANGSAAYVVSARAAAAIAEAETLRLLPTDLALFSPYDRIGRRFAVLHADPGLARQYFLLEAPTPELEASAVAAAPANALPPWREGLDRLRETFDRDIRRGIPKTLDIWRSGATKQVIPFEP